MKRIVAIVSLVFLSLVTTQVAHASTIASIDIVARIQADGSALITDTRTFEATEGTEHYISFANLGQSDIRDFSVVLDGQPLTDVGQWDVERSREEKAGQSGVVKKDDGYELAFGFGEYGTHTAVMTYTVTNFVYSLSDGAQAVYWQFIPRGMTPTDAVRISLTNDVGVEFSADNSRVWGFGYDGTTTIEPAALKATTNAEITSDRYMVILAIFDSAPFTSQAALDETAASLEERAKEGSDWSGDEELGLFGKIFFGFLGVIGVFGLGYAAIHGVAQSRVEKRIAAEEGLIKLTKKPGAGKGEYWRDIPYDGPLEDIVKLVSEPMPGLATAYMLEWIRQGALRPVPGDDEAFTLVGVPAGMSPLQQRYWDFLVAAAKDGILDAGDVSDYIAELDDDSGIDQWGDDVDEHSLDFLRRSGYCVEREMTVLGTTTSDDWLTARGQELSRRIDALQNYLTDFSLLNERGAMNVMLWDQYMVWAGFLGIADEVAQQFALVDPRWATTTSITPTAMLYAHSLTANVDSAVTTASAGGGGSASFGGGGGSFGGGFGGGVR
ncbi:DUF2207 domain-containing protein [Trueperella pecoris]|uniref:DUF2207 domain-containing protein n=1 Tax=Trueperella pecoris TaxID=2733571 RepID=A0A7M1R3Z6_9ACTO|nr:DUF2207 domain-containing protein [Trueperella pecoris]QOR48394.1 DUF2207 domain-containing protein [Trueperella pecoris]